MNKPLPLHLSLFQASYSVPPLHPQSALISTSNVMIHQAQTSPHLSVLPVLPPFSLSPVTLSPSQTPQTVSSSSTGATDPSLTSSIPSSNPSSIPSSIPSSLHSSFHPYRTDLPPCPIPSLQDQDLYALHDSSYIPILPRTNAPSTVYTKRCETCSSTHDGSFGAGRFCSSRCARTVGGLAHRKKRMMERESKQRSAAEYRARAKKPRIVESTPLRVQPPVPEYFDKPHPIPFGYQSPKTIISIHNLLNPSD